MPRVTATTYPPRWVIVNGALCLQCCEVWFGDDPCDVLLGRRGYREDGRLWTIVATTTFLVTLRREVFRFWPSRP
jgi:hypothetical protein